MHRVFLRDCLTAASKALFFLAFLFGLLLPKSLQAHDWWCLNRHFSVFADYAYLRRSEIRELRLVEDTAHLSEKNGTLRGKKVMDTENLVDRLNFETALRGGIIYSHSPCTSIEALYLYTRAWRAKKTVEADATLRFPFEDPTFTTDFEDADRAVGRYLTRLQNGELNYWGHITCSRIDYFSCSWNLGLSGIYVEERFSLAFTRDKSTSDYKIRTENWLLGPQLGAVLEINPTRKWTWVFRIKGAAFANNAQNKLTLKDLNNTVLLRRFKKTRVVDSYLIEGYGQLSYYINGRSNVHIGYEGFLLKGLALAPEQRDVKTKLRRRVKRKGQIVIDGLFAGVEICF